MTIKCLLFTNLFPVFVLKIGDPPVKVVCLYIWTVSKQITLLPWPSEQTVWRQKEQLSNLKHNVKKRKWISVPIHSENKKAKNNLEPWGSTFSVWEGYILPPEQQPKIIKLVAGSILCWKKWTITGHQGGNDGFNEALWTENLVFCCSYHFAGGSPFIFSLFTKVDEFKEKKKSPGGTAGSCKTLINCSIACLSHTLKTLW